MKAYKVFKVANGELHSAFEMGGRGLKYKEGQIMIDPKPDTGCEGLSILLELEKAKDFLRACPKGNIDAYLYIHYVLYEVYPLEEPRPYYPGEIGFYSEAFTDALIVGRRLE